VGINAVEALGSVTRMVAVAREVRQISNSHDILFRSAGAEALYAEQYGFRTVTGYKPAMFGMPAWAAKLPGILEIKWDGSAPPIKNMEHIIRMKGLHTDVFVEKTFSEWESLVRDFKPDIIVSEFDLVAPAVAKLHGIPIFTTLQTPGLPSFYSRLFFSEAHSDKKLAAPYNRVFKKAGLKNVSNILECFCGLGYSQHLIPSIPEMEEIPSAPINHYTGSIIPQNSGKNGWDHAKKRPLIYLYLSVGGQIGGRLIEKTITEAFSGSAFDVMASCSGNPYFNDRTGNINGNITFSKFLPSGEVLKQADIAVHHGGQNSTLQCIEAKVPSLIFPGLHFERFFNAEKAASIGCAMNLPNRDFTSAKLRRLCENMIKDNPFAEKLEFYSGLIRQYGGSRAAAEIILSV